jgi:hypothetical protein
MRRGAIPREAAPWEEPGRFFGCMIEGFVKVTRCPKHADANLLDEVDMREQGAAWVFLRIGDTDLLAELLAHDFNRLQQVGIVRYHHGDLKPPHVNIVQQVRRKIYVRPLFLRLYHSHVLLTLARRHRERHCHLMAQEMAKIDRDTRHGSQRAQRSRTEGEWGNLTFCGQLLF